MEVQVVGPEIDASVGLDKKAMPGGGWGGLESNYTKKKYVDLGNSGLGRRG